MRTGPLRQRVTALLLVGLVAVSAGGCTSGLPVNGRATGSNGPKYVVPARKVIFESPEFIVSEKSARLSCFDVLINDNPKLYYAIFRNGSFDRVIVPPLAPTVRKYMKDGTPFDLKGSEDPEKRLHRVLAAPRIAPASITRDLKYERGREPWNILPAFIILAPLLVPDAALSSISSSMKTRNLMKAQDIQLDDTRAAVERLLGKPHAVSNRGNGVVDLQFGPAKAIALDPSLAKYKTLVRMKGDGVYGVFFDDFCIDPK
ncbi:MAG TPA: hypothetical protein VGO11_22800 [Chthoniobacteraceae bacterium]|jgi:hypothetical protein|nr:hypothetical protein [Chthoniobacteraceae bacterium]